MAEPMDVSSPAAAFARQARTEAQVETALRWSLRLFLGDVESMALRDGTYLSPASVGQAWSERMGAEALATRLPEPVARYVAEVQALADTPEEAYDTAMAVLIAANERAWSRELTEDALAAVLAPASALSLTAAAPRRDSRRGKALRAAMDEALGVTGTRSWYDIAKRDARTAVTGLDGMMSVAHMRQIGATSKRWVTRRDRRVRDAHAEADGQTVPVNEPFIVGGYPMMHPGDRSAPPALTVYCRCVVVDADSTSEAFSAYAHADSIRDLAEHLEPRISRDMKRLAAAHGTRLEGYEFRLKSTRRISDKILRDVRDKGYSFQQAASLVSDSVRYTMLIDDAEYVVRGNAILDDLRARGYLARTKNAWVQTGRAYKGVNIALTSPDGQLIELQFHTERSLAVKQPMHDLYQRQQENTVPGSPEWQALEDEMMAMSADVPIPPGIDRIRDSQS